MQHSSSTAAQKLDGDVGAYLDKLAEHPLMTQFNVMVKHLDKDLLVHWPVIDDSQWESIGRQFLFGPVKDAIQEFARQYDYPDILVTLAVGKKDAFPVLSENQELYSIRFETEHECRLLLMCQESFWHPHKAAQDDHSYIIQIDDEEEVYRETKHFLDLFYNQHPNLLPGAKEALKRTLLYLFQLPVHTLNLPQGLYSMFVSLGLISGVENVVTAAPATGAAVQQFARVFEAYALTQAVDQTLSPEQQLYFRGLAQQLRAVYQPAIKETAMLAAADIDHHHEAHPDAQKAHQDMTLRQRQAQRLQTLDPGMDGGGSEG